MVFPEDKYIPKQNRTCHYNGVFRRQTLFLDNITTHKGVFRWPKIYSNNIELRTHHCNGVCRR